MSAYVIVHSKVIDTDKMAQYGQLAAPTVAKFGGEFLVKGKAVKLHGVDNDGFTNRAVIQFGDLETAQNWYDSPEYQALTQIREQAMNSRFELVAV